MSSINDMKNQMMHNDNIKMCLLQKCEHAKVNVTLRKRQTYFNRAADDHTFSA